MRRARRWLAALMIVGLAGAQFMSLARACTLERDIAHALPAASSAAAMPADCPFMGKSTATPMACEPPCMPMAQTDRSAQAPIAPAPSTALVVRQVAAQRLPSLRASPPLARNASPPLLLRFGRLLI